jgi:hypothetical protein
MTQPAHSAANQGRVRFGDIQRFLTLFAQGLSGSFFHLKVSSPTAAGGRSSRISTDGHSIYLPADIADFAAAEHNLGSYRIAVLHQIGYVVEGTFDFDLESFCARWHRPALLRRVFLIVEDLRIDTALRRRYPGARADLDRVLAHALAKRPSVSSMRPLSALIEGLVQYSLGGRRSELISSNEALADLMNAAEAVCAEEASIDDSARASLSICANLEEYLRRAPRRVSSAAGDKTDGPRDRDPAGDDEFLLEDASSLTVEFRGELHLGRSRTQQGRQIAIPGHETRAPLQETAPKDPRGGTPDPATPPASIATSVRRSSTTGPRSFLYDEWDYLRQTYLSAWCRVYEHRLRGDDFAFISDVRRRHCALGAEVRRQFAFIKPQSWQRVHRTIDGDELELDAVIEAVIDRRSTHAADSHLYLRRDRALRDVAAAFLVDMSASTDFPIASSKLRAPDNPAPDRAPPNSGLYLYGGHEDPTEAAPAPKRRVIDVSKDALALMCDALQTLGDSFAIYGFSGDGRDNVEFHVAKEFREKLSVRTWAALAAIQPRRSTRMGPAIRHALSKLAREPAGMKVLIIVSDGYPEDHDYGMDRNDREYGIQDTARALREAERAGVVDFCVTIDPAGNDYLRRMCSQSRYLVIDDVTALPRELTKVYRTLTS